MPKHISVDVPTPTEIKDAVSDKVEDTVESAEERVNALSTVKKAVLAASAVVVTYSIVSGLVRRVLSRNDQVIEADEIIVVTEDDIEA